jgi:hypothetical protein
VSVESIQQGAFGGTRTQPGSTECVPSGGGPNGALGDVFTIVSNNFAVIVSLAQ